MFRMTLYGHRLSNGGLTDSHLPLDVPGGSLDLGYLPRDPPGRYPNTRVNPHIQPTPNGRRILDRKINSPNRFLGNQR